MMLAGRSLPMPFLLGPPRLGGSQVGASEQIASVPASVRPLAHRRQAACVATPLKVDLERLNQPIHAYRKSSASRRKTHSALANADGNDPDSIP